MAFTGQLGVGGSQLGSILLGSVGTQELSITVSSNLNNWQDSTAHQLGQVLAINDTLIFSDALNVVLGLNQTSNDSLNNWLDNVDSLLPAFFTVSIGDSLNNWDDLVELFKQNTATQQLVYKLDEVNYIRRYLNDVVTEITDTFTPSSITVYKPNEITYIRRYLNDV